MHNFNSSDSSYNKFVKNNLKVSHHHHICNWWHIKNVYLHTTFHMPCCNSSLVIAIKAKAKYKCLATTSFYIAQKITLTEVAYFLNIYYHTKFTTLP